MKKVVASTNPDPLLIVLVIVLSIWQLYWKAVALWKSSQLKQRNWFIAFIVLFPLNELGILEIIYLFWFAKKRLTFTEIKSWFVRK